MTTEKIAQRDFIALEKNLALIYANDLQSIKAAEKAIEVVLSEARRLLATTEDRSWSLHTC